MLTQKLHILNIPELEKIIKEIKEYFNYKVNYFNEKKDLIKKIKEDKEFLENSVIIINQKDFYSIKSKTDELDPDGGIIYTGNADILKEICPADFGKIKKQGFCMIGVKNFQ